MEGREGLWMALVYRQRDGLPLRMGPRKDTEDGRTLIAFLIV